MPFIDYTYGVLYSLCKVGRNSGKRESKNKGKTGAGTRGTMHFETFLDQFQASLLHDYCTHTYVLVLNQRTVRSVGSFTYVRIIVQSSEFSFTVHSVGHINSASKSQSLAQLLGAAHGAKPLTFSSPLADTHGHHAMADLW